MKKLVRLWKRPSRDDKNFAYVLIYKDERGKRKFESLRHTDGRKAERQRTQKERELRMGAIEPDSMKLSDFLEDSMERTRGRVRDATMQEYNSAMREFINVIGNIDYHRISCTV